ncbi:hypothetical protein D3C81_2001050 [compost metagenome]
MAGVRLLGVHQRQGAGRQGMTGAAALVTADPLEDGAYGEGVVAMTAERLSGKVRMEQLHPRQPGARQHAIGIHPQRPSRIAAYPSR